MNDMAQVAKNAWWTDEKEREFLRIKDGLKNYESTFTSTLEAYKKQESEIRYLKDRNEHLERDLKTMTNKANKVTLEKESFQKQLNASLLELETTRSLLNSKEDEMCQFKLEKTQTKAISTVAGERMVKRKNSINDLSDREWQQKLSEMFVSLYDDSWTDAFKVVKDDDKNDQHACKQLLLIFKSCWAFCLQYSKSQLEALQLTYIKAGNKGENTKREILETYPSQLIELIQDTRRYFVQDFLPRLQQIYWTQNETNLSESLRPYVQACLQMCWYSAISDPALHYVFTADNLEHFRSFTQSGNDVDYVVWPALLMHEFGPLLLKGVVQFKKIEEKEQ